MLDVIHKKKTLQDLISICLKKEKETMFSVPFADLERIITNIYEEYEKGFDTAGAYRKRLDRIFTLIDLNSELTQEHIRIIKANSEK